MGVGAGDNEDVLKIVQTIENSGDQIKAADCVAHY